MPLLKFRLIWFARKLSKIFADQFLYIDSSMNEQRRREEKKEKKIDGTGASYL